MAVPMQGIILRSAASKGRFICRIWPLRFYSSQKYTRSDEVPKYTVTTPIFYVNAAPHIGHLYTCLLADASSRWKHMNGYDVKLVTGTDEHGLKIQQAAKAANLPLPEYCTNVSSKFNDMFKAFDIDYTDFIRTTDRRHIIAVEAFWKRISHYIYKGYYSGWYCMNDEAFLSDNQVLEVEDSKGQTLMVSKESGQPCEVMEEENYIFPLHKFQTELNHWLSNNVVCPSQFKSSLYATLDSLGDLSVSRSSQRLPWGIPVPNDPSQTIYVWLDALVNYLTACGYPHHMDLWPVDCHVVGKDILKFHAIYWPAFLMAADLPLPKGIVCHSHWTVNDRKMSKSIGNVVNPMDLVVKYQSDGLRYFLLREGVLGHDGNYNEEKMVEYLNSELCNTLGNLLSRCTSKSINSSQVFPPFNKSVYDSMATSEWSELLEHLRILPDTVAKQYDEFYFYRGLEAILTQLRLTNGFMESLKPWDLKDKPDVLNMVLHVVMENLRVCGILLQPIIPRLSSSLLDSLGVMIHGRDFKDCLPISSYTKTRRLLPGSVLYPRISKSSESR